MELPICKLPTSRFPINSFCTTKRMPLYRMFAFLRILWIHLISFNILKTIIKGLFKYFHRQSLSRLYIYFFNFLNIVIVQCLNAIKQWAPTAFNGERSPCVEELIYISLLHPVLHLIWRINTLPVWITLICPGYFSKV